MQNIRSYYYITCFRSMSVVRAVFIITIDCEEENKKCSSIWNKKLKKNYWFISCPSSSTSRCTTYRQKFKSVIQQLVLNFISWTWLFISFTYFEKQFWWIYCTHTDSRIYQICYNKQNWNVSRSIKFVSRYLCSFLMLTYCSTTQTSKIFKIKLHNSIEKIELIKSPVIVDGIFYGISYFYYCREETPISYISFDLKSISKVRSKN